VRKDIEIALRENFVEIVGTWIQNSWGVHFFLGLAERERSKRARPREIYGKQPTSSFIFISVLISQNFVV